MIKPNLYRVEGSYTYKVTKNIQAYSREEALELASNHSEALCEWDSIDKDSYSEKVDRVLLL